jgi:hypothetical protein
MRITNMNTRENGAEDSYLFTRHSNQVVLAMITHLWNQGYFNAHVCIIRSPYRRTDEYNFVHYKFIQQQLNAHEHNVVKSPLRTQLSLSILLRDSVRVA